MNRTTSLVILIGMGTIASPSVAHQDHDPPAARPLAAPDAEPPKPQHGGQAFVVDAADGITAEALFSPTGLDLWFFAKDMKPLAPPAIAKLTLTVGKEVRNIEAKLDAKKPDRLSVETPLPAEAKVALFINATLNGKKRSVRIQRAVPKAAPIVPPATTTPATPSTP